jgi:hypothetical protein
VHDVAAIRRQARTDEEAPIRTREQQRRRGDFLRTAEASDRQCRLECRTVRVGPGAIAFTRTPRGAASQHSERVKPMIAAFAAE